MSIQYKIFYRLLLYISILIFQQFIASSSMIYLNVIDMFSLLASSFMDVF